MFVQMKWHKSAPDGQAVEFAFSRTGCDENSVKITSFLNALRVLKKRIFYLVMWKKITKKKYFVYSPNL